MNNSNQQQDSDFLERMPDEKSDAYFEKIKEEISERQRGIEEYEEMFADMQRKTEAFKPLFVNNCKTYASGGKTDQIYKGGKDPFSCIFGGTDIWRPDFFMERVASIAEAKEPNKMSKRCFESYQDRWLSYWYPRFSDKKDIKKNKPKALHVFRKFLDSEDWGSDMESNKEAVFFYFNENYETQKYDDLERNVIWFFITGKKPLNLPNKLIRGRGLSAFTGIFGISDSYLRKYENHIWGLFLDESLCRKNGFSEERITNFYEKQKDRHAYDVHAELNTSINEELADGARETMRIQEQRKERWKHYSLAERREIWADHMARQKTKKEIECLESEVQKNKRLEKIAEEETERRLELETQFMNIQLGRQAEQQRDERRLLEEQMRAAKESQKTSQSLQESAKRSQLTPQRKDSSFTPNPPTTRNKAQIVYAIQQGRNAVVYGPNNVLIRNLTGTLKGYTTDTFTVQNGSTVSIYNADMTLVRSYKV